MRGTSLDPEGLTVISTLPHLSFLDISECRLLRGDDFAPLSEMKKLKVLICWETRLDDAVFTTLGGLTELEELDLKATSVTDESVETLLGFTKLKKLNLAGTQLTDEGFIQLSKLPSLTWLNVANTNIGFDIIDELKAAKPELTVQEFE